MACCTAHDRIHTMIVIIKLINPMSYSYISFTFSIFIIILLFSIVLCFMNKLSLFTLPFNLRTSSNNPNTVYRCYFLCVNTLIIFLWNVVICTEICRNPAQHIHVLALENVLLWNLCSISQFWHGLRNSEVAICILIVSIIYVRIRKFYFKKSPNEKLQKWYFLFIVDNYVLQVTAFSCFCLMSRQFTKITPNLHDITPYWYPPLPLFISL